KTKSVIVTDSEHIILSALPPETIMQRQSGVKDNLIAYEERIDQDE
ncbi:MAG: DUF370 domain-containing protein, partial [Clostridia bacterium]|nr:DUF370 domain-containing protein [Clostridia bacterium]